MFKLFIFVFLFFTHYSLAKTLEIDTSLKYETQNYLDYSIATKLDEIPSELTNRIWTKDKKELNKAKYKNSAYWARIKIKNISKLEKNYYFKAENQFTYKIDYYLTEKQNIIKHIEDGVIAKNPYRAFNTNHMLFPLHLKPNAEVIVYFKIRNYNKININFTLINKEYLIDYYQTYDLLEGIFFGGMLLMMLSNLFLYFLLKVPAYLYYVAYVFSLSIYFIGLFGFSQRYFETYTYIFYFSSGSFFVFLSLFVQSILNLKEKLPKIHNVLNLFILFFIVSTLINVYILETKLFSYAQLLFNIFFTVVPIFVLIIISSTYYLAYFKKDTIAKFYSIIWSFMALSGLLLPLQYLNIINIDIPSNYIFQFLILFEVLFFSFILAYKINLTEREKKEQERLLVQQNKLASMGEVITMIAHQWRQPLSEINGIVLNLDIDYQKKQLPPQKFNTYLDNIELTTKYMSQTINDFMDYFKHNKKIEEFTVASLIEGTLNLLPSKHKNSITIKYINPLSITLIAYRSELIQALLIVINNAIDACMLKNSATNSFIIISTKATDKHILISIKDNGCGIPPAIMDKIYNPYFTTKHKSKGTGLGLYILKMIIEESLQGKVEIKSSQKVTICNLYIPMTVKIKNTV